MFWILPVAMYATDAGVRRSAPVRVLLVTVVCGGIVGTTVPPDGPTYVTAYDL